MRNENKHVQCTCAQCELAAVKKRALILETMCSSYEAEIDSLRDALAKIRDIAEALEGKE